jgi:hypothetical protein
MTKTEMGGVLVPNDIDEKSRLTIKEVLQSDVTNGTIEQVAHIFYGSSVLGVVDSQAMAHWLLAQRLSRRDTCWQTSPIG